MAVHNCKPTFTKDRKAEIRKGQVCDNPNIGGARQQGRCAPSSSSSSSCPAEEIDHSAPSHAEMTTRVWFKELVDGEDSQPNAKRSQGSVQIDTIDIKDLYKEYEDCMVDKDTDGNSMLDAGDVLNEDAWRKLWLEEFPELIIRETKNLLSKDLVRPRLRLLARDRKNKTAFFREKIKSLRGTYRATIIAERMFYYSARAEAIINTR